MSVYRKSPRTRSLTPDQFALEVDALRDCLLIYTCRTCPCTSDDAEDLLQDAVIDALRKLESYDAETGTRGLVAWMKGLLHIVILRCRKDRLKQPSTVPLVYALPLATNPPADMVDALRPHIHLLPEKLRNVVTDHLDGYLQDEIARRNRIHRNTVANRMALAAQQLRCSFPSFEDLWDNRFFLECSIHATYTKQNDMTQWWMAHHPSERQRSHREKPYNIGDPDAQLRDPLGTGALSRDPHLLGAKRRTDAQLRWRRAVV
jgi:DNA-directed RNA polymerase specialized sigma24 family protein